jgi:hypothetical protein
MPLAELKEHEAGESSCSQSWYQIQLAAAPAGWMSYPGTMRSLGVGVINR